MIPLYSVAALAVAFLLPVHDNSLFLPFLIPFTMSNQLSKTTLHGGHKISQETLHFHGECSDKSRLHGDSMNGIKGGYVEKLLGAEEHQDSLWALFKNWPPMSSIVVYCVFQLHDMTSTEVFPFNVFLVRTLFFHVVAILACQISPGSHPI